MPSSFIAFAHQLADASGEILRRHFRAPKLPMESKEDNSPVTLADREAEAAMRVMIETQFPAHGFLGEESGNMRSGAEYIWVIDPIDGTKNFMTGQPIFGTLIALIHNSVPILGVIDQPIMRERWVGIQGMQTTLNGTPVSVDKSSKQLNQSIMSTTSPYLFAGDKKKAFERLQENVKYTVLGSDCYAYAMLSTGCLDLVVESGLKTHDVMALIPVILGAGGVITDWQGEPVRFNRSEEVDIVAAAHKTLHAAALAVLQTAP